MKRIKYQKIISMVMILIIALSALSNSIIATTSTAIIDSDRKATLTIVKYEHAYGQGKNPTENVPLEGVEFTAYLIEKGINLTNEKSATTLETEIKAGTITPLATKSIITPTDGTIRFNDLELGRYLIVESNTPKNVSVKMESFLIDLPRTTDDGRGYNYDVTVYPKNITVYGDVTFTKYKADGTTPLQGVAFELQKANSEGTYLKYDYEGELITDSLGQIKMENLPVGDYRIVEIRTLSGYILDQSSHKDFTVTAQNTTFNFNNINENPDVKKEIKTGTDTYGKDFSTFTTERAEWKIESDIPTVVSKLKTYTLTDTLPTGIDIHTDTIDVNITNGSENKHLVLGTDYTVNNSGRMVIIAFNPANLQGFSKAIVTYSTSFNDNVTYGADEENSVTLTYTNKINIDGTPDGISTETTTIDEDSKAEVHTGKVLILKTDKAGDFLSGAKFKISTSLQNAKDAIYIKNIDGADIIETSDSNGQVIFKGLKYGSETNAANGSTEYWITEVESPTYLQNGEIKHYNLLPEPVKIVVDSSHGEVQVDTTKVINKKGFTLPLTGGTGTIILTLLGMVCLAVAILIKKMNKRVLKNKMSKID